MDFAIKDPEATGGGGGVADAGKAVHKILRLDASGAGRAEGGIGVEKDVVAEVEGVGEATVGDGPTACDEWLDGECGVELNEAAKELTAHPDRRLITSKGGVEGGEADGEIHLKNAAGSLLLQDFSTGCQHDCCA